METNNGYIYQKQLVVRLVDDTANKLIFSFYSWPDDNGCEIFERLDSGQWKEVNFCSNGKKVNFCYAHELYRQLQFNTPDLLDEVEEGYGPQSEGSCWRANYVVNETGRTYLKAVLEANKDNQIIDWALVPVPKTPEIDLMELPEFSGFEAIQVNDSLAVYYDYTTKEYIFAQLDGLNAAKLTRLSRDSFILATLNKDDLVEMLDKG